MKTLLATLTLALFTLPAVAGETYRVDPVHSVVLYRIHHANAGQNWGRFNDPTGTFTLDDADPAKSTIEVEVKVDNLDTHNAQRDGHLKSPDFFNAKQFPTITFKSTGVKKGPAANTLDVTGDLTMHGTTKSITIPVEVLGKGNLMDQARVGVEAVFTVKMSEFGFKGNPGVGDEVKLFVALEGAK
jgi:polyisoprenoid-binding protein YceI